MLITYTRSTVVATPTDYLADLVGLICGTKDLKSVSTTCDTTKSKLSGSYPTNKPTISSSNEVITTTPVDGGDPIITKTPATQYWLAVKHPLYEETIYLGIGYDSAKPALGMWLRIAKTKTVNEDKSITYGGQPSRSNLKTFIIAGDLTAKLNQRIELIVSDSGILFMTSHFPYTQEDQMLACPRGLFTLEAISSLATGVNTQNGVSMFALGGLDDYLEATALFDSASGKGTNGGQLTTANTNLVSLGAYANTSVTPSSETVGYSHNGILETSFLETFIHAGNYIYAKLHGYVRPLLVMNHSRYEVTLESVTYIGFVIGAITSYANSYPSPAAQLFAYIKK
ncbi:hypothetical protein [Ewingella americana]|uniref:Uncharacterized protein n=1 Tax=Ewingella americana TaxID=41202 RepID=A0A502GDK5_9GAMM|nr:hypothetical protein [Ewingella americana]TPG59944.1 hypothetical protein EAH77_15365 [Ewingella americana]